MQILNKTIEFVIMFYYCLNSFFCAELVFRKAHNERQKSKTLRRTRAGLSAENEYSRLIADWPMASLPLSGQFLASLRRTMGSAGAQVEVIISWKSGNQL
jgi:hypothetical protein